MRTISLLAMAIWVAAPTLASAQTRLERLAEFYDRTGHPEAAEFYVQLQKKQETPKDATKPGAPLDQLIAEALKQNPDIRVAESKVRETEAELNRTRMKVVSEVTFLHAEIQAAQAMVDYATKQHERMIQLKKAATISDEVYREAALALEKAKADLAAKQAKLPYLLGRSGNTSAVDGPLNEKVRAKLLEYSKDTKISDEEFARRVMIDYAGRLPTVEELQSFKALPEKDRREKWVDQMLKSQPRFLHAYGDGASSCIRCHDTNSRWSTFGDLFHHGIWFDRLLNVSAKPDTPMAEKLRKALDSTLKIEMRSTPAVKVFEFMRDKMQGVNVVVRYKSLYAPSHEKGISANFGEPIALGAFVQYVEDELNCTFILREYGVVIVSADEKLPPGAVRVVDFWKRGKTEIKEKVDTPKDIRGKIEKIDDKESGLVSIDIGSDAGVKVNQMLSVIRMKPQARFHGMVRILNVTPQRAMARVVDSASGPPMVGDEVSSQLTPEDRSATK